MRQIIGLLFCLVCNAAIAQTAGTLNLQGPSANPANPQMSLSALSAAINAQLANKLDAGTALLKAQNGADIPSASAFRTSLSLGTASTVNTGTSGGTIPLLNGANTWGAAQSHGTNAVTGSNFGISGGSIDGTPVGATSANSGAFTNLGVSGGSLSLTNGTANNVMFGAVGLGDPTVTARSAGTKLVLYPAISGTSVDYAVGVTNNKLWTSAASSSSSFAWFLAASTIASLDSNGFNIAGGLFGTSGNMSIAPSSASALINFKTSSSGSSIVQVGGSNGNVNVQTQLQLNGRTWSGASPLANAALYENSSWSGTSNSNPVYMHILQSTETITSGTADTNYVYFHDTAQAGFSGNRLTALIVQDITGSPATAGGTFVGITPKVNISANMGGTGVTSATSSGFVFGENPVAASYSGATNLAALIGSEVDVLSSTGSSMMDRIGQQIVLVNLSSVAGSRDDAAFSLNNQFRSNGGAPWLVGIGFGRLGGYFPIAPTGTLIKAMGNTSGDTVSAANGVDLSAVSFSGNSWTDGKNAFTGSGQHIQAKMTASGAAPGAGKMQFEVVTGTNAGSCRLIAYAGTSTTAVTLIDNVGSGC